MMELFTLVLLRHGQSHWNHQNRFTGWMDVTLTAHGRQEARQAGQWLRQAGLSFDQAYTSMLCRAWESLDLVREQLEPPSFECTRVWELNERHYGSLQCLNKAETARRLGEDRVMAWRRSYAARPPALEMDDARHPRFDERYAGLPANWLPRSESLKDTAERLVPFWENTVTPEIRSGKRVLIVAHGNSLRALVKHIEQVPEPEVPAIHVPTGVPIVYQLNLDMHPVYRYDISDP